MSDPEVGVTDFGALPRRTFLADEVYEAVLRTLLSNDFTPGQRLTLTQIAHDLQISVTPVRHALTRLESDGFVTKEPYRGFVVSDQLGLAIVDEIFDARIVFETALVSRAAVRATEEDITLLSHAAASHPFMSAPDLGLSATITHDAAFHARIAEVAGSKTLAKSLLQLHRRMATSRTFWKLNRPQGIGQAKMMSEDHLAATQDEHEAIARGIANRDLRSTVGAMRVHLENARDRHHEAINETELQVVGDLD